MKTCMIYGENEHYELLYHIFSEYDGIVLLNLDDEVLPSIFEVQQANICVLFSTGTQLPFDANNVQYTFIAQMTNTPAPVIEFIYDSNLAPVPFVMAMKEFRLYIRNYLV